MVSVFNEFVKTGEHYVIRTITNNEYSGQVTMLDEESVILESRVASNRYQVEHILIMKSAIATVKIDRRV